MPEDTITQDVETTTPVEPTTLESISSSDLFRQAREEKTVVAPKEDSVKPELAPDAPVEKVDAPAQASAGDAPATPSPVEAPPIKVDAPDTDPEKTVLKAKIEQYEREREVNQQYEAARQLEAQEQQVYQTYNQRLELARYNETFAAQQMQAALENNDTESYAQLVQIHANQKALREGIEAESNYFLQNTQQRKLAENNKRHQFAVESTLKEYGLEPKHLIEIDPKITPSDFYGVLKVSLAAQKQQLETKHQSEIKLVRDTATREVKEAQAKWRVESPGSVTDTPAGSTAGKNPIPFESKSSTDYFKEAREEARSRRA